MSIRNDPAKICHNRFLYAYLVLLALSGFVGGVAFCFSPKPDTTAVTFLACVDAVIGIVYITLVDSEREPNICRPISHEDQNRTAPISKSSAADQGDTLGGDPSRPHPASQKWACGLRVLNRILMVVHLLLAVIFVAGSIELAMAYRYVNP
jgi:hypothetical protein